jgi:hypothetical protein
MRAAFALLLLLASCKDPDVPVNASTTMRCWDGEVCPEWQACPSYEQKGCKTKDDPGGAPWPDQAKRPDAG